MPPGTYTVKLVAGGQELTQPLSVLKDPNATASDADVLAQTSTLADMRKDLESVADMVNSIELVRKQLADLNTTLQGGANAGAVTGGRPLEGSSPSDQLIREVYGPGAGHDAMAVEARLQDHVSGRRRGRVR
jgi:hypothetical protein